MRMAVAPEPRRAPADWRTGHARNAWLRAARRSSLRRIAPAAQAFAPARRPVRRCPRMRGPALTPAESGLACAARSGWRAFPTRAARGHRVRAASDRARALFRSPARRRAAAASARRRRTRRSCSRCRRRTRRRRESARRSRPRSSLTCWAVVGEMRPKRLADGAAMPFPPAAAKASSSARATGCDGLRTPTRSCPPVTASDTRAARGRISVSGPGQNASASRCASAGISRAQCASCESSARCTMTG